MDGSNKKVRVNTASDEEDERMFAFLGPDNVATILDLKHNTPGVTYFYLAEEKTFNEAASRRLGHILGQNTQVDSLHINYCVVDMIELCVGLQNNKSIKCLDFFYIDLSITGKMTSLAPFLTNNPSLHEIRFAYCDIESAGLSILSNSLSSRTEDTLRSVDLPGNEFGDANLDELVGVLDRSGELNCLDLGNCGIGQLGLVSLSRLLDIQDSTLTRLYLHRNFIDNQCALMLAGLLRKNTRLTMLDLAGNGEIGEQGWKALLALVYNKTNIESVRASNHTLEFLTNIDEEEEDHEDFQGMVAGALGAHGASLLHASLKLNRSSDKAFVAQQKVLWGHARGDYNIGTSPMHIGEIPPLLSRFGNPTDETISSLVEFHEPPLPGSEVAAMRLDSVYRIVRSAPCLWCQLELSQCQISQD